MHKRLAILLLLAFLAVTPNCGLLHAADGIVPDEASVLTGTPSESIMTRIGYDVTPGWTAGMSASIYSENLMGYDASGPDWALGCYAKISVDPNANLPLSDWLPWIGSFLNLPETVTAETYGIGEFNFVHADGGSAFITTIGPGAQIGPFTMEYVYVLVEGGEADDPLLSSGPLFRLGLTLKF